MEEPIRGRQAQPMEVDVQQRAGDSLSPEACRRLVGWPLGIAVALLTAAVAVGRWNMSLPAGVLCGLVAAVVALRARNWLEGRIAQALSGDAGGSLLALSLDILVGAGAGLVASRLLGSSPLGTVASGAGLAGAWSFVVGKLLCGGGVERGVDLLLYGNQGADYASAPILADGEALEREGQLEGAIRKYREVAAHRPREAEAYLRAALLLKQLDRPGEAAELLRQARRRARLAPGHQLVIGQQLAELAAGPLADPAAALAELAVLSRRFRGSAAGEAAQREMERLRGRGLP